MKRLLGTIVVLGLAGSVAQGATPLYISGDVPTTETATSTTLQPYEAYRYSTPPSYTLTLSLPGNPVLSGIHRMDKYANWLFSVESPNNLGGGPDFLPADVIQSGFSGFATFFCGATVGVPQGSAIDALCLQGGDAGDLLLSFDVPTTMGAFTFQPGDLVRFVRTGPLCGNWALAGANPAFSASAAGVPPSTNVVGADMIGSDFILSFDVPTTIGASTYLPGQIVRWNGATFSNFETLAGWPTSSIVDGLAWVGNPGLVPATLLLTKTGQLDTSDLILTWTPSCSEGASDYGIYEGSIGSYYSHTRKDCNDGGVALTEQITPAAGPRYYLVVPHNVLTEGSYGQRRDNVPLSFTERPLGGAVCATPQILTPCP